MSTPHSPALRSLYRRLLRELPTRTPRLAPATQSSSHLLSNPSPLQHYIRTSISSSPASSQAAPTLEETEQFIQYVRAQRMYVTLVERYNPGMNLSDEERIRLTARRVGMEMPVEEVE